MQNAYRLSPIAYRLSQKNLDFAICAFWGTAQEGSQ